MISRNKRYIGLLLVFSLLASFLPVSPFPLTSVSASSDYSHIELNINPDQQHIVMGESATFSAFFSGLSDDPADADYVNELLIEWEIAAGDSNGVSLDLSANRFNATATGLEPGMYTIRVYALNADRSPTPFSAELALTVTANLPQVKIHSSYAGEERTGYKLLVNDAVTLSGSVTDYFDNAWPDAELHWTLEPDEGSSPSFAQIWDGNPDPVAVGKGNTIQIQTQGPGKGRIVASATVGGSTYSDSVSLDVFANIPHNVILTPVFAADRVVEVGSEFRITFASELTSGGNLHDREPRIGAASQLQSTVGKLRLMEDLGREDNGYTIRLRALKPGTETVTLLVHSSASKSNPAQYRPVATEVTITIIKPLNEIPHLDSMLREMKEYSDMQTVLRTQYDNFIRRGLRDKYRQVGNIYTDNISPLYGEFFLNDVGNEGLNALKLMTEQYNKLNRAQQSSKDLWDSFVKYRSDLIDHGHGSLVYLFEADYDYGSKMFNQIDKLIDAYIKGIYHVPNGMRGVFDLYAQQGEETFEYAEPTLHTYFNSMYTSPADFKEVEDILLQLSKASVIHNLLAGLAEDAGFFEGALKDKHLATVANLRSLREKELIIRTYFREASQLMTAGESRHLYKRLHFNASVDEIPDYPSIGQIRALMRKKGDTVYDRDMEMVRNKLSYQDQWRIPLVQMPIVSEFVTVHTRFKQFQNKWLQDYEKKSYQFPMMKDALNNKLAKQSQLYNESIGLFLGLTLPYLDTTQYSVPFHSAVPGDLTDWSLYFTDRVSGFFMPVVPGDYLNMASHITEDYDTVVEHTITLPKHPHADLYMHRGSPEDYALVELELIASIVYQRGEEFSRKYAELKARVEAENIGWMIANTLFDTFFTFIDALSGDVVGVAFSLGSSITETSVVAQQDAYRESLRQQGKMSIKRIR